MVRVMVKTKLTREQAVSQLWEIGELSWKLRGNQKLVYDRIQNDPHDITCILISRRFGKCVAEGTEIPTTKGLKKIEDIEVGDWVYGYNEDGSISPTQVKQKHDQGIKPVVDLVHSRKVYATVTEDHRFLTYNPVNKTKTVKKLKDMYSHEKIVRKFIKIPCGEVDEYSLLKANNSNEDFIGFKKVNKRRAKCWDIGIDNGTHLYVMQNGLITHNSFTNCVLAVETCLKTENAIVKYACPQQRMVKTIIKPMMREILKDCPDHIKPEWREADKIYSFPNGSEIQLAGTDNGNAENLRGGHANLLICDEAGFMDDLDYVVNSILLPTTDTTDGKLVLTSTPNYKDPDHEFHQSFVFPMEASDRLIKFTVYDSPMVNEKKIEKIIARYPGGKDNPKFRCEYLVEVPRSSEYTVVPEFYTVKPDIVTNEIEVPPFYDPYVSMDVGFKDLTVALFAYYDFMNAKIVILDELVMNGPEMTTDKLADEIRFKEKLRFYDEDVNEQKTPYLRVMDNDLKLINDLSRLHQLQFVPTNKDNKEAAVNNLRMWIHQKRVIIHPRCKHLIYHLENAQWDSKRKQFKHLKDSPDGEILGGHADALDSIIYLCRNVLESKNPYPFDYGRLTGRNVLDTNKDQMAKNGPIKEMMNKILNIKNKH